MPADSGLVFVVVLHPSPEHESILAALLGSHTAMSVVQVQEGTVVEANHVYVIPPRKHFFNVDGHLRLSPLEPERGRHMAVDVFFRTLADTHSAHSAAVVLSGADGDGASRTGLLNIDYAADLHYNLLPGALGALRTIWPDVAFNLCDLTVSEQLRAFEKDELDLSFVRSSRRRATWNSTGHRFGIAQ